MAKSICTFYGENNTIYGSLVITQANEEAKTIISGQLSGLKPGKHGFHIGVFGDVSQGGTSCGGIFNPFGKNHGGLEDKDRRVGSLGNIEVNEDGTSNISIEDGLVKLIGPHSIIGRSLLIRDNEDDLGKGGHELSLTDGNSGPAIAWGVVGITV